MARFKKIPQKERVGKIVYGNGIVEGIVELAVSELEHVELIGIGPDGKHKNTAIKVIFDKDGVNVEVSVKIHYSQRVPDMAFKIQEAIRYSVESMTEYHVSGVNVNVNGITFEEKSVAPVEPVETVEHTVQEN